MLNGLKPLSRSLRWGMVGGGEPVRSATATAVRRCVTMFIPCWPARLTSMPSAGERSVSNWASRRSAATPTTRPCFAKRRSALTGSRSSRSPPRTIPISPSPKRRWRRDSTLSAKSPLLYRRRGARAGGSEQKTEQNRRRYLRLCRLSDDPAGAADDCRWTARRDPHR